MGESAYLLTVLSNQPCKVMVWAEFSPCALPFRVISQAEYSYIDITALCKYPKLFATQL